MTKLKWSKLAEYDMLYILIYKTWLWKRPNMSANLVTRMSKYECQAAGTANFWTKGSKYDCIFFYLRANIVKKSYLDSLGNNKALIFE